MTFTPKAIKAALTAFKVCRPVERTACQDFGMQQDDIIRQQLEAALSAALAVDGVALQGWQDISTAPKDGTPVDLWCANSEFPNRVTDAQWRKPTESEWFVHGGDGMKTADAQWLDPLGWPMTGDDAPTHWQPLPPPPAASDREERR